MLRLECRGRAVEATALSPNGVELARLVPRSFDNVLDGTLDERARLLAAGPLDALRAAVLTPRLVSEPGSFCHFAAGIFSYDLLDVLEELPQARLDETNFPDYVFWLPDRTVVVDHVRNVTTVTALVVGGGDAEGTYNDAVRDIERLVRAVETVATQGDIPQFAAPPPKAGEVTVDLRVVCHWPNPVFGFSSGASVSLSMLLHMFSTTETANDGGGVNQ